MKLIDRYLVWHFLIPFAYCLFAFVILYITYDLSINMDDFFRYKISFSALSQYYLYNLPLIFVNSAPIAILLSLLYSLGLMNRHHEIVALRASGVHIGRILLPFLIVGTILAVFIFYINDSMVCTSFFEKTALREQIFEGEESKITTIWKNIPFRNPASNRDWFIEQYNFQTKELTGIVVREFDNQGNIARKVAARSGKWIEGQWWFFDAIIYYYENGIPLETGSMGSQKLEKISKKIMSYEITPEDLENTRKDISSMNFRSLLRYLTIQNKNSSLYKKILVDLYDKIAFPFVCIIAVLIGIPFAIRTQRGGFIKGIGVCIILFLLYYGVYTVSIVMGKKELLDPLAAVWLPNILFLIFGVILIKKAA